ncbi:PD-(D/E)XK nuclease-like domain-containing protein [Comamonas testosteroni]|uniref:PD-(D/E)XK nuclease-like domain-containing protein n=1 Tax=Comamonas testosteroni TaxID=285 RepID=UPI0005B4B72D|nr:PD-(D/E)XK nuclease-like domain-containing protein [Comamonas testosteroni]
MNFNAKRVKNSNSEYHADKDILSSSMLKNALISPLSFIHSLTTHCVPTPSMMYGTLMHTLITEPQAVNEIVALSPTPLGRDTASRLFREANPGRFCMWIGEFQKAQFLANMTLDAKFRGRPFHKFIEESVCERSTYYTDPTTGMKCRTRSDIEHPEWTFDLKTTRFYGPREFQLDSVRLHYDLSAYMYTFARVLAESQDAGYEVAPKPFVLVPIFNTEPFGVFFRPCSNEFLVNGQKKYNAAMKTIAGCRATDFWPTTSGEVEMGLEHWQQYDSKSAPWMAALNT